MRIFQDKTRGKCTNQGRETNGAGGPRQEEAEAEASCQQRTVCSQTRRLPEPRWRESYAQQNRKRQKTDGLHD